MIAFCSFATRDRLPHARLLARSIERHHPGSRLTLCVPRARDAQEPFEVLSLDEADAPFAEALLAEVRLGELAELLTPHLLARALADPSTDAALFLDPRGEVVAPLDPVLRALDSHALVLVPRVTGELPVDHRFPNAADLRNAGKLSPALVAVGRDGAEALEWWRTRVERSPRRPGRWRQLAPAVFPRAYVLDDPGCGLSPWNAHSRQLEKIADELLVDGHRLRYVQLADFDPTRPFLLHPGAERTSLADRPVLAELCRSYAERLAEQGWQDPFRRADVGRSLPNGLVFDDRMSQLHAEAEALNEEPGEVFTEQGCSAFTSWLEQPGPHGAAIGVNRYTFRCYRERDDLGRVYPDLDGADAEGFAGWCWVFGVPQMGIPSRFLPHRPAHISPSDLHEPPHGPQQPLPRGRRPDLSVNVMGLLRGTLGLGEAARGYARALQAAAVPTSTTTIELGTILGHGAPAHDDGYGLVDYEDHGGKRTGFNLVCINADELPELAKSIGEKVLRERPTVGVWAWETDVIPERWKASFALVDEIWVYSTYVAENLRRVSPVPVRTVPPPVTEPDPAGTQAGLDVPEGFRFLFMFDFLSTIQRKNPVGLIRAFREAFAPGEGPQLVIKTINGRHRFAAYEEVKWAARGRPDVHLVDRSLNPRERDALLVECDCYVSLHRSEGFGLPLAECMALGKPVVGTDFGGTRDFMTGENSYLVPWSITHVGADCDIYPAHGRWAEPDVDAAAATLRRVVENPHEAAERGRRAREDVRRLLSPEAVGRRGQVALKELRGLWN